VVASRIAGTILVFRKLLRRALKAVCADKVPFIAGAVKHAFDQVKPLLVLLAL
jgi:hypothetical protein